MTLTYRVYFDPNQPRDRFGRWRDVLGIGEFGKLVADWKDTKPWERPKDDFMAGRVPGFRYSPHAEGYSFSARMGDPTGDKNTFVVTDAAFAGEPDSLRMLLYHEVGHKVADALSGSDYREGTEAHEILKPWLRKTASGGDAWMNPWSNPYGDTPSYSDNPNEILADAYSMLIHGDRESRTEYVPGLHGPPGETFTPEEIAGQKKWTDLYDAIAEAAHEIGLPDRTMFRPVAGVWEDVEPEPADPNVAPSEAVNMSLWPSREFEARFDALSDDDYVWLFHSTRRETAEAFTSEGISTADKPMSLGRGRFERGEPAEFQPGAGLGAGLTVSWRPSDTGGYGHHTLAVRVRKGDIVVSPEQASLGATKPSQALRVGDAMVVGRIPPEDVVPVGEFGFEPNDKKIAAELAGRAVSADRYEARKVGKDWRVVDTADDDRVVQGFNSRRGYPASSLEIKARSAAARLNEKGSGTESDPYKVADPDTAVRLLGEGFHVRLDQPSQVSTLLDRLAEVAREMEARGEDAPDFDLCRVTVAGTNLFCVDHHGLERLDMPQLRGKSPIPGSKADAMPRDEWGAVDLGPEFADHLRRKGVKVESGTIAASHMRASQRELDGVKVAGMARRLRAGATMDDPPILLGRSDYVIDGHHRWAAKVGVDLSTEEPDPEMNVVRADLDVLELIAEARRFADEWGMPQKGVGESPIRRDYDPNVAPSTDPAFHQAFHDVAGNAVYEGIDGKYHYRLRSGKPGGPVVPWNDVVRAAFPEHLDLRAAALEYIRPITLPGTPIRRDSDILRAEGMPMKWSRERTPGGMTVHTSGEFRIESYKRPSERGDKPSGYHAGDVKLYRNGKLVEGSTSVAAAKARAEREAAAPEPPKNTWTVRFRWLGQTRTREVWARNAVEAEHVVRASWPSADVLDAEPFTGTPDEATPIVRQSVRNPVPDLTGPTFPQGARVVNPRGLRAAVVADDGGPTVTVVAGGREFEIPRGEIEPEGLTVQVAPGDYETPDGRYRAYRVPGLRPTAWNVEAVWTDDERDRGVDLQVESELVVDGAASLKDARALFVKAHADYEAKRLAALVEEDLRRARQALDIDRARR